MRIPRPPSRRAQRGVSLIMAVFLIVILAALAVYLMQVSTLQHGASLVDLNGSNGYHAARAGVEWAALRTRNDPGYCPAGGSSDGLALGGELSGFAVTVQCARSSHDEAGTTINLYQITSTASVGAPGAINRVERQIRATIAR